MKQLFLFACFVLSAAMAPAQNKSGTHYLMISVYEHFSANPHSTISLLVKNENGNTELTVKRTKDGYSLKNFKEEEDSLFALLKPYLDEGWILSASNTIEIPVNGYINDILTRYFLYRKEENSN